MNVVLLVLLDAAGVAIWVLGFRLLGRRSLRKASWKGILLFLLAGVLAGGLACLLEYVVAGLFSSGGSSFPVLFLEHVLTVGLVEEWCKFFLFILFFQRIQQSEDPRYGMILAMITALGFSGLENLLYGFRYGIRVLIIRFWFSTSGHVSYAGLWGYIYASLGCSDDSIVKDKVKDELLFSILLIAAVLHGLSNVFTLSGLSGAYLLIKVFSLLPALLAYRFIGRVLAGKVTVTVAKTVPRRLSKKELYRRHYRAAWASVNKRKYDRALDHIGYCKRAEKNNLFLLFLEGLCLYALGRKLKGYGAMASALTDMKPESVSRVRAGVIKLVTEKSLKQDVLRLIEEE